MTTSSGADGSAIMRGYIHRLRDSREEDIATYEADRVSPYMLAYGRRLQRNWTANATPEPKPFRETKAVISYRQLMSEGLRAGNAHFEPGRLSGLFKKTAAETGCILLSEVSIISEDVWKELLHEGSDLHFFGDRSRVHIAGMMHQLGFVQFMQGPDVSIAFPVMVLDSQLMERMASYDDVTDLLDSLSQMVTITNHDVLHHITSPVINDLLAKERRNPGYSPLLKDFILSFLAGGESGSGYENNYEGWALSSHSMTIRDMRICDADHTLDAQVERYFTALEKIENQMRADNVAERLRFRFMDYLGMIALCAITRSLPLHDPLVDYAMTRIEKLVRPEGSDLTQYMRDRYRNPKTQYPEQADLNGLGAIYLDLIERPGFLTNAAMSDIAAALSSCILYECGKPDFAKNSALRGISPMTGLMNFDSMSWDAQETVLSYVRALAHARFDEEQVLRDLVNDDANDMKGVQGRLGDFHDAVNGPVWPNAEIPVHRRTGLLNMMRETRALVVQAMFRAVQSYLHRHPYEDDFDDNITRLGLIHVDGLRRQIDVTGAQTHVGPDIVYLAARNYRNDGLDILGAPGVAPTWRQLKMWEVLRLTPIISYLMSPKKDDAALQRIYHVARTVDRGVVAIVGNENNGPG